MGEISSPDLSNKLVAFFSEYCAPDVEPEEGEEKKVSVRDFKLLNEIHDTTKLESGSQVSFEDIIFHFLQKVIDLKETELAENLPRFWNELIKSSTIPKLFAMGVLIPLVDAQLIEIKSINWLPPAEEDDYVEVEGNFRVMAHFLNAKYNDTKEMSAWFNANCKVFMEDRFTDAVSDAAYLITEIKEDLGEKAAAICDVMGIKE